MRGRDAGDLRQWVDRAGRRRAGGRDDGERADTSVLVALDRRGERIDAHALRLADGDRPHGAGTQPQHVGGAADHEVRLVRGVDRDRSARAHGSDPREITRRG